MSLVADYNSDSSLSEEEPVAKKASPHTTLKSKKGGPVKIVVDLPKHDSDIEEEIEPKKQKLNRSNSSLSAILPTPKRSIKSIKKDNRKKDANKLVGITNFVPHTVNKPKLVTIEKNLKIESNTEENKKNQILESFFPLDLKSSTFGENELPKINQINPCINNTETTSVHNFSSEHTNEYIDYYGTNTNDQEYFNNNESCQSIQESEQIQSSWEPDEEVFQKLGGRRGKNEGPIKIKEINAADQMANAWQSQITDVSKPAKGSSHYKPTKVQKRKHNLMYLAYQANAMENDMKEQHASNKKTKRETQAKYGF
ncbi:hypothetical protein Glove_16g187 [Diversispora epigaea]|uniref:Proline-rich protein PRCC n=1 Tax=Diversispora epigaea TaxID=1348612 RepID=A0A397JN42_9GLOM|nr:hypothetical protein Glove_16g187 [Diversispora epigaea]